MKIFLKILDVLGLLVGVLFLIAGGTDIQLGFGVLLSYLSIRNLCAK